MKKCPTCGVIVVKDRLAKHREKVHGSNNVRGMSRQPATQEQIRQAVRAAIG